DRLTVGGHSTARPSFRPPLNAHQRSRVGVRLNREAIRHEGGTMKSLKRLGAGSALACLALCGLAAPAIAKTLAVHHGQSIQKAIGKADPGDVVLVKRGRSVGNREGILARDASTGTIIGNNLSGNCAGLFVLADAPGPATDWTVTGNNVSANNKQCPAEKGGEPATSGIGIALIGAG